MPLAVYMDVHVPAGVSEGLRRKRIDVRTAQEDSAGQISDEELLTRATVLGRVLFTQDSDFLEMAARWQRQGITFDGVLFTPQGTPMGRMIETAVKDARSWYADGDGVTIPATEPARFWRLTFRHGDYGKGGCVAFQKLMLFATDR